MSEMKNISVKSEMPSTMGDVPPHVYALIAEFLVGVYHDKIDLRKPYLRASIQDILPVILVFYGLVIMLGAVANIAMIVHIAQFKRTKDPTYTFIINNAISDVVKCMVVLPLSLYVLVIQNWMLGELLCSFLPMLQDIPFHVTTLTFVLTAWDRHRYISYPNRQRLPAFVCAVGTWLAALCLVLPFPIYIIYVDLGRYANTFDGIGFCVVNLTDDMQEYMRGIFLVMYAAPLATISYLYIKTSRVLNMTSIVVTYGSPPRANRSSGTNSERPSLDMRSNDEETEFDSQLSQGNIAERSRLRFHYQQNECAEPELDPTREKRVSKYLSAMVTSFAICYCPLMILRVARLVLFETYENASNFDITYTLFVWIAFLPTCFTPAIYASWHLSRETKERLRGYFRIRFRNQSVEQRVAHVQEVENIIIQPHWDIETRHQPYSHSKGLQQIEMVNLQEMPAGLHAHSPPGGNARVHRQLPKIPFRNCPNSQMRSYYGPNLDSVSCNEDLQEENRLDMKPRSSHQFAYQYYD